MLTVLLDLTTVTALLILGNFLFRPVDPHYTLAYRACKIAAKAALTAPISYFYVHRGVLVASGLPILPIIYVLPRKGINGWPPPITSASDTSPKPHTAN